MNKTLLERAMEFLRAHHRRHNWYKAVSALAVVVVFVTTYMLILPAITMEVDTSQEAAVISEEGSGGGSDFPAATAETAAKETTAATEAAVKETAAATEAAATKETTAATETATTKETTAATESAATKETTTDTEASAANETLVSTDTSSSDTGTQESTASKEENTNGSAFAFGNNADDESDNTNTAITSNTENNETELSTDSESTDEDNSATAKTASVDNSKEGVDNSETDSGNESETEKVITAEQIESLIKIEYETETIYETEETETVVYGSETGGMDVTESESESEEKAIGTIIHWTITLDATQTDITDWVLEGTLSENGKETDLAKTKQEITINEKDADEEDASDFEMPYTFEGDVEDVEYVITFDNEIEASMSYTTVLLTVKLTADDQDETFGEVDSDKVVIAAMEDESETESVSESESESESETENITESETETETEKLANETLVTETESSRRGLLYSSNPSGGVSTVLVEEESNTEENSGEDTEDASEETENANANIILYSAEESGTPVDLEKYITSVTFRQKDEYGIWQTAVSADGSTYTLTSDTSIQFTLNYTIPAGVVTTENNVLTYQLPDGFTYSDTSGNIVSNGSVVGEFTISDDGTLKLVFDKDSSFFDTDVDFTGYVTYVCETSTKDGSGSASFSDSINFSYTVEEKETASETETETANRFNVDKTASVNANAHTIAYKLDVTPGSYGATNVVINDTLTVTGISNADLSGITYDSSSFSITNKSGALQYVDLSAYEDRTPEAGYYYVEDNGNGSFTLYLPDMSADDEYFITYTVDLNSISDDVDVIQSYSVSNTASDANGSTKDTDWQQFSNTWVTKSSTMDTDEDGDSVVTWTLVINPNNKSMLLADTFTDTMKFLHNNQSVSVDYTNALSSVTVDDPTGSSSVTWSADVQSSITAENLMKAIFGDGGTGNVTIKDILTALGVTLGEGTESVDYSITIVYTTMVDTDSLLNGATSVSNTGTITQDGISNSGSSSGGNMYNYLVTKAYDESNGGTTYEEVTYQTSDSGAAPYTETKDVVALIPWVSTIKIPETAATDALTYDSFGDCLWATPELLKAMSLTYVDSDNEVQSLTYGTDYTILDSSQTGISTYSDELSNLMLTGGFYIQFTSDGLAKVAHGYTVTLKYSLYGTYSDLSATNKDTPTRSFSNQISYNGSDASASYNYTGSYFEKVYVESDDDSQGVNTDNSVDINALPNGRFHWRVQTKLNADDAEKDITLVDTLPAGLKLYSVKVTDFYGNNATTETLTTVSDGTYSLKLQYYDASYTVTVEISTDAAGITTVSATIPASAASASPSKWFNLEIEATIADDEAILDYSDMDVLSTTYTNTAKLIVGDNLQNEDSQTTTVTNDKSRIDKSGSYDGATNYMTYTLEVNKGGDTLLPDGNGTLTLTDVLKYTTTYDTGYGSTFEKSVDLVAGSVTAYYYDEDNNKITLPSGSYDFSYTYSETEQDGTASNTLTMTIPDGLHLYIEYSYLLVAEDGQDISGWKLDNTASLEGVQNGSDSTTSTEKYEQASAGVTKDAIVFYKVDASNYNHTLSGATFALLYWDSGEEVWKNVEKDSDPVTYTSDSYGRFTVGTSSSTLLKSDTLYCLKETAAPSGYTNTNACYYFYLKEVSTVTASSLAGTDAVRAADDDTNDPLTAANSVSADDIHALNGGNLVYLPNKSDGSIEVRKVWADGATPASVTFTLYQGTSAGYTYEDIAAGKLSVVEFDQTGGNTQSATQTITYTDDGNGNYTPVPSNAAVSWTNLPSTTKVNGVETKLYYYVFETTAGDSSVVVPGSDGSYTVGSYAVEYSTNGIQSGTITVTNSTKSISATKTWADGTTPVDVEFTIYQGTKTGLTWAATLTADGQGNEVTPELTVVTSITDATKTIQYDSEGKLASGSSETVTWMGLAAADSGGNPLYYYVFETKAGSTNDTPVLVSASTGAYMVGNYYVTNSNNRGITQGTVTINNADTSISVTKKWGDGVTQGEVTMELYSSTTAPTKQSASEYTISAYVHNKYTFNSYPNSVTYNGKNYASVMNTNSVQIQSTTVKITVYFSGSGTTDDLEIICLNSNGDILNVNYDKCTVSGNYIIYEISNITEDCVFYITISENSSFEYLTQDNGSIEALTVVSKDANLDLPDDITSTTTPEESITFNTTNNVWSYTWSNLSLYNSDGQRLYYYVKEADQDDYYASYIYEYNSDGSIKSVTVTNYDAPEEETEPQTDTEKQTEPETTSITIEKQWKDSSGAAQTTKNNGDITIDLYQRSSTTAPASGSSSSTVSLSVNLTQGSNTLYSLKDDSVMSGSTLNLKVVWFWSGGAVPALYLNDTLITNPTPTTQTLEYHWGGECSADVYEYSIILNTDSVITGSFSGNLYDVEIEGELIQKSGSSEGTTNLTPDEGESVYKQITISASDSAVDTTTTPGTWTYTITGLPYKYVDTSTGDDITYYYTYFIVEHSVTNYTTTYSNNVGVNTGTVTITNKAVDNPEYELPETGGTGTTPYTYGGLLLTLSAAGLLVYKKKKHGKEVRSGPS